MDGTLLATAALWVQTQTSLTNTKWATLAKEWPTHYSSPKSHTEKKQTTPLLHNLTPKS